MRFINTLLICGAALLLACADNTTNNFQKSNEATPSEIISSPDSVAVNPEPLKLLNQENYEAHLRTFLSKNPERKFKLTTRLGVLKVRIFDDTPLHTANFLMLIERDYFNNTEFTRVAKNFVVQGGNNENEHEEIKRILIGNYLIEPEFQSHHIHRKGALAMARSYTENPGKKSAAFNFYFVQGQTFKEPQLLAIERDNGITIPEEDKEVYRTIGGAPHLDGEHTVFGEIYEGLDVLEKMSLVKTDESEWPLEPLVMQVEIIQ